MINDIEDLKECNHQLDLENQALRASFNEQQAEIERLKAELEDSTEDAESQRQANDKYWQENTRLKAEVADLTRDRNGWGDTAQMLEAKLHQLRGAVRGCCGAQYDEILQQALKESE